MKPRKTELDALAIGLLLAGCLLWGFQQVLIKATLTEVAPLFQASLRVLGATALLGLWCAWRRIPLFKADGSLAAGLLAGAQGCQQPRREAGAGRGNHHLLTLRVARSLIGCVRFV